MKQFDSTSYFEAINSDKLTLVKYKANWCGPCRVLSPILEDVVKNYPDINFGEVDVDNNVDLAFRDNVKAVPAVIFYKNGQVLDKMVGLQQAQAYQDKINSLK
jgi:thioredoxin 1